MNTSLSLRTIAANLEVNKVRGPGSITYDLQLDAENRIYFKMTKNSEDGRITKHTFRVDETIQALEHSEGSIKGYDENELAVTSSNANDVTFLRAIVGQLLPTLV